MSERWLLDTSVVVDLPELVDLLPEQSAISVVTLAELSVGPLLAHDARERARRQRHLQAVEAQFDPLPVDAAAARAFGELAATTRQAGRQPRRRQFDLLIAAVARSQGLPLATRNADDLAGLEGLVEVRPL